MKKFSISFVALFFICSASCQGKFPSFTNFYCTKCVQREKCKEFGNLNIQEQKAWEVKYPCPVPNDQKYSNVFGFAASAKGDFVCCPSATIASNNGQRGFENRNAGVNSGYNPNVPNDSTNNWVRDNTVYNPNYYNRVDSQNGGIPGLIDGGYIPQAELSPYGFQRVSPTPKYYFPTTTSPSVTSIPLFPGGNNFGNTGPNAQCAITSFPPKPETGCCGLEASETERIAAPHAPKIRRPAPNAPRTRRPRPQTNNPNQFGYPIWSRMHQGFPRYRTTTRRRVERSAEEDSVNISIGNRIAGGSETEFEEFPWTVHLRTTFDYGNKKTAFECGGSLISSRYVLTAGHCVFDTDGEIMKVEVFLAEYDKRTFPIDCKIVLGQGEKCIENVVMESEDVFLHEDYDDSQLKNDIALIRLRGNAPYTNYIRPICLPSIDVDTPDFLNLRLAVAGWGRNGRYRSEIKQSTIVNLVPQEKCKKFYTDLSRGQVCAAGYNGEDTCKGDSGGPLMAMFSGKYHVVGVVSGKRADSPCGTAVPSLYTNVYHYLDWIHSIIKK